MGNMTRAAGMSVVPGNCHTLFEITDTLTLEAGMPPTPTSDLSVFKSNVFQDPCLGLAWVLASVIEKKENDQTV